MVGPGKAVKITMVNATENVSRAMDPQHLSALDVYQTQSLMQTRSVYAKNGGLGISVLSTEEDVMLSAKAVTDLVSYIVFTAWKMLSEIQKENVNV